MSETLAEALPRELARAKALLLVYKEIGPAGAFGALMIANDIANAERAIAAQDIVAMLASYETLQELK